MNSQLYERLVLQVASLLHDIGKLYIKAHIKNPGEARFSECEPGQNYAHACYSAGILERLVERSKSADFFESKFWENVIELVKNHHNKDYSGEFKNLLDILKLADGKASSTRAELEKGEGIEKYSSYSLFVTFKPYRKYENYGLYPEGVYINREYPIPNIFMLERKEIPSPEELWGKIWHNFESDLGKYIKISLNLLNGKDLDYQTFYFLVEKLRSIIKKHLWSVPAQVPTGLGSYIPDISLYSHSLMVAALADALYFSSPEVSFIYGDVSGIQRFIFNIDTSKAAKELRGRSFFIQYIVEAIARTFIKENHLSPASLIFSSGGNYLIASPKLSPAKRSRGHQNGSTISDSLEEFVENINRKLLISLQCYSDSPFYLNSAVKEVNISSGTGSQSPLDPGEILYGEDGLMYALEKKKKRPKLPFGRVSGILPDEENKFCQAEDETPFSRILTALRDIKVGIRSGRIYFPNILKNDKPLGELVLEILTSGNNKNVSEHEPIYSMSGDLLNENIKEKSNYCGEFPWFLGVPIKEENGSVSIKTLEEIAKEHKEDFSGKKLGDEKISYLSLDVDSMGYFFHSLSRRLTETKGDFSLFATLSHTLTLFFEDFVPRIREKIETFDKSVYLIFSGGDDLLAVGQWKSIIQFTALVRAFWDNMTLSFNKGCQDPSPSGADSDFKMTLSAGIYTTHPKATLKYAVEATESMLKSAKNDYGKNVVVYSEMPLNWESFFAVFEQPHGTTRNQNSHIPCNKNLIESDIKDLIKEFITYPAGHVDLFNESYKRVEEFIFSLNSNTPGPKLFKIIPYKDKLAGMHRVIRHFSNLSHEDLGLEQNGSKIRFNAGKFAKTLSYIIYVFRDASERSSPGNLDFLFLLEKSAEQALKSNDILYGNFVQFMVSLMKLYSREVTA